MKKIIFDISNHGYGHVSQTVTVINALQFSFPDTSVILRSAYSATLLRTFLDRPAAFELLPAEPTLEMRGPLQVDRDASSAAYVDFHASWASHIARRMEATSLLKPDLLVCNAPYVSLAAAARLGVPAIALCSLNWLDMRAAYCKPDQEISGVIHAAYESAVAFLQPTPHMPMHDLANRRPIGPIARKGVSRRLQLRERLALRPDQRIVLVTFGGVTGESGFLLPLNPDIVWLVQGDADLAATQVRSTREIDMTFIDILASVDAVLCKDGYSTTVEAACCGTRIFMLTRADWPETPYLVEWAQRNACFTSCPIDADRTMLAEALEALLNQDRGEPVAATGVSEAVHVIAAAAGLT